MSLSRLQLERDLYLDLLRLGKQHAIQDFLSRALRNIVDLTGAERGYIELDAERRCGEAQSWFASFGCETADVEAIRARVSRGIIAEARSAGSVVVSHSALLDARFSSLDSVRAAGLEAVLCAPIMGEEPLGILYLEGRRDGDMFSEEDRSVVELFREHLAPLAERALLRELQSESSAVPDEVRRLVGSAGFLGRDAAFVQTLRTAATVAPLDVHVLLTGESGTGKTQLARLIHNAGPHASEPFVELNCGAIPQELVEKELFGAVAGAFTGATSTTHGQIAAAGEGTLFLDEISELPMAAQPKLLQFLQSRQYTMLGSTAVRQSKARIIAATNVDLRAAVVEKRFREDLMWRLQVLPIRMPSLDERRGDIDELAQHFCATFPLRHGLPRLPLTPAALRALRSAQWPGNIRQLEHVIEAALIRAAGDRAAAIGVSHLFPDRKATDSADDETFQEATRNFQAQFLLRTLEASDWNISECARRLDLARSHVYTLIQAFGLRRMAA